MTTDQADQRISLHHALGALKPPESITQEAFDDDEGHLRRLLQVAPGERPDAGDLLEYIQDILYSDIQGPLFVYLLPFCLEGWRDDLRGTHREYGRFVEFFYTVLATRNIFATHLTPQQGAVVAEFMRQSILEEIDDQRGLVYQGSGTRPYRWFLAMTTYGVLLPDMERLRTEWWSLATPGRAIAAVQYVSCLIYPERANPVFLPGTREQGGGPPCLWEFAGPLYRSPWLEPNVNFLQGALTVAAVNDVLNRAVERLLGQPEHDAAAQVQADLTSRVATLTARCTELPKLLAKNQTLASLTWSTHPSTVESTSK
jgi:hypothetical protein